MNDARLDKHLIKHAMTELVRVDSDIARVYSRFGPPPPRIRPQGFETFFSTIVSQQLSTVVAQIIMQRVKILLPEVTPEYVLKVEDQALRDAGLSFRKIGYAKGLAQAICDGRFDIAALAEMPEEAAIESITALKGFGRWSAEIYLMFSLNRQDIFAADDLALRVALGRLKDLKEQPTPARSRELVKHWSPWRSVGSLFLWHYYRGAPA